MKNSKGFELNLVAGVILAAFGILVFLAIMSKLFPDFFSGLYCRTYEITTFFFPGREGLPAPKACQTGIQPLSEECKASNSRDLAILVAGDIARCWEKYSGYGVAKEVCRVCIVKDVQGWITESDINDVLIAQKICPQRIENGALENTTGNVCGSANQIDFKREKIKLGDVISIEYLNGKIVVR